MRTVLIVTIDFADYKRGDRIEDPATVAKILASHNASHCVVTRVAAESRFGAKE